MDPFEDIVKQEVDDGRGVYVPIDELDVGNTGVETRSRTLKQGIALDAFPTGVLAFHGLETDGRGEDRAQLGDQLRRAPRRDAVGAVVVHDEYAVIGSALIKVFDEDDVLETVVSVVCDGGVDIRTRSGGRAVDFPSQRERRRIGAAGVAVPDEGHFIRREEHESHHVRPAVSR